MTTYVPKNDLEDHLIQQMECSRTFFWNRLRWRLIVSQLPAGPCDLVDVGAGTGFLGEALRDIRPDVRYRFVEPLESLEASLSARFGPAANARGQDLDGASVVTLLDVLEHQEDDHGFLVDLAAKMRPGSVLLLTVPAMQWLWSDWDRVLGHHRRYTKRSLRAAARGLGLQPVETSYLFPEMVPPALVRRWRRETVSEGEAEFPVLPDSLNKTLYGLGSVSLALRRLWPVGTSVFAKFIRTGRGG